MSTEELTELLEDEDKFTAFVRREAAKAHIVKVCTHTLQRAAKWHYPIPSNSASLIAPWQSSFFKLH